MKTPVGIAPVKVVDAIGYTGRAVLLQNLDEDSTVPVYWARSEAGADVAQAVRLSVGGEVGIDLLGGQEIWVVAVSDGAASVRHEVL